MTPTFRRPSGTPEGGRFAGVSHPESEVRLEDLALCPSCDGSGATGGGVCFVCEGSGSLDSDGWDRQEAIESAATTACGACDGGITADLAICAVCDGSGVVKDYSLLR